MAPIYKFKNDFDDTSLKENYRPISLLTPVNNQETLKSNLIQLGEIKVDLE
jgi:hypothetical protein